MKRLLTAAVLGLALTTSGVMTAPAAAQCQTCNDLQAEVNAIEEHIASTESAIADLEDELHGLQLDLVALLQVPESQRGSGWYQDLFDWYVAWADADNKLSTENDILSGLQDDLEDAQKALDECVC